MASIRKRAPWRVVSSDKDETSGTFTSKVKAEAHKATTHPDCHV